MHQHIHHAAGHLILGQRVGQLRVHNGEAGPLQIGVETALCMVLFIRQHRRVAQLAACGGDGQHHADGQGFYQFFLAHPKIPNVHIGIGHAVGHALGRVDDAAAAHCQQKVSAEGLALLHHLTGEGQAGVGLHAAQGQVFHSCCGEGGLHAGNKPTLLGALAAVDHHGFRAAKGLHLRAYLFFTALAEQNLRGRIKIKPFHRKDLLLYSCPQCTILRPLPSTEKALPQECFLCQLIPRTSSAICTVLVAAPLRT